MQLFEQYRPSTWSEVVGQPKAIAQIELLAKRGLSGRGWWISGKSGTGKSSLAYLIAQTIATPFGIQQYKGHQLTSSLLEKAERETQCKCLGTPNGRVVIVNEAHALRKEVITDLLDVLEKPALPDHAAWIFTTTVEGNDLFGEQQDSGPFGSRCNYIALSQRGLAEPFAQRAYEIACAEGLDGGQPLAEFVKLAKKCGNNLREMLCRIEDGCMVELLAAVA